MALPEACLVLREAEADELIITADFAATGRTAATFHDLTAMVQVDQNIWEIAPVRYGDEAGMTGADQVARWAADIRASGRRVSSVVGFCGGSVYAAELAAVITGWQQAPNLILLDPGIPVPSMLNDHIAGWTRRLEPQMTELERAEVAEVLGRDREGSAPLALAAELGELFRQRLCPALRAGGNSDAAAQRFADLVNGYLHWLAGAMSLDPRQHWRSAPTANSNSPGFGLFLAPPEQWADLVGPITWFDVPHFELMRTPEVAWFVEKHLSGVSASA
ncbi:hypothetical protein [Jatrophihabitans sp.]|jgi:hypothetical protein|uniref:hypothetical protein n=1 Tax=Jatrophihabitans sp. TaxID=1932789 RepID=UPI002EF5D21B